MSEHPGPEHHGTFRIDYDDPRIDWHLADGDVDLAPGVQALLTAGHTPGHQSFVVTIDESVGGGGFVFAFDAADLTENIEEELAVGKRRYNCFLGTELELLLRAQSVETVVICGVSSDICVHWTAGEAFQRDFHVRVVEDCVAGMSQVDHVASLLIVRNLCAGGRAVYSIDVLRSLEV